MSSSDDWPQLLREQGRSMTWLAHRVGVSRQYLSAVAAGARQPSPALAANIRRQLQGDHRLEAAGAYAGWRAAFLDVRAAVAGTLVEQPELQLATPERLDEMAEDVTRVALWSIAQLATRLTDA